MARGKAADIDKKRFETIMVSCYFFSADQVADCLDVSRTTLWRWLKKEYPGDTFETLQTVFSSKYLFQLNAYRMKAMQNGNGKLIERSMEEAGLWPKRDAQKLDMTVHEGNQVLALIPDDGRESNDDYKNPPATAADAVSEE